MDEIVGITPIRFGKVRYKPGAPKNAPKWVWACACEDCLRRPIEEIVHGPFRTRREAYADADQAIKLIYAEPEGRA
jgi:hypothetical protein